MERTEEGILIVESDVHSQKALLSIVLTDEGIDTSVKFVQFEQNLISMISIAGGNITFSNE